MRNFILIFLLFLNGCSLLNKKGDWGKHALWPVKGEKIKKAFIKNVSNAHVWAPVAAGAILYTADYDKKISNWAIDNHPVFGSSENASEWSDTFNEVLLYEMYANILLTPSQNEDMNFGGYVNNKVRGGVLVNVSDSATRFTTDKIRKVFHRTRPDESDNRSLPSGHASAAGSRRALNIKMLESIDMNNSLRLGINSFNTVVATGTMWSRIEGEKHYPSDVLFGYALGSFVSGIIYDSLINLEENESVSVIPVGDRKSIAYTLAW